MNGKKTMSNRQYAYRCGAFNDRKSAFDYFFIVEGKSIEEADRLSGIIANARGVPVAPPPPAGFADKAKKIIAQCTVVANENPRIVEFLAGLVAGAVTSITGVAVGNKIADQEPSGHEIDVNTPAKDI